MSGSACACGFAVRSTACQRTSVSVKPLGLGGGGFDPAADITAITAVAGRGVQGGRGDARWVLGHARWLGELGVDLTSAQILANEASNAGQTQSWLAGHTEQGWHLQGLLAFGDTPRPQSAQAVATLRAMGIRSLMLSGDNRAAARAVAAEIGLAQDDVRAELLPDDKLRVIRELAEQGPVGMVGDGLNDAPALAAADVGIAMGTGTDVAMESAGITLLKGDLSGVSRAVHISRATMTNIRQNLALSFVYNLAGVPVAAGVLYPAFGWTLSPALASAAMALSSVSVIVNALRLSKIKL